MQALAAGDRDYVASRGEEGFGRVIDVCVAQVEAQGGVARGIELDDASEIEDEIRGTIEKAFEQRRRTGRDLRNTGEGTGIAVEAGADFSEDADMVSAYSAFEAEQTLKNPATVMHARRIRVAQEEVHGGVRIKKAPDFERSESADGWLRANAIKSTLPLNDEGGELGAKFQLAGNRRFRSIFVKGTQPIANAHADAEVVGDLAGAGDKAGSGRGGEIWNAVGIAADLKARDHAGSGIKLDAAAQVHEEVGGRVGGER